MINYKNPVVELVPDPLSLDKAIQGVQEKLADIAWLEKAFGRCIPQRGVLAQKEVKIAGRTDYIYPEVWYKMEPQPLMINDNLKAYCFFYAKDPMTFDDYDPAVLSQQVTQPVSIIFWANLKKIDPAKKYNFTEHLRKDVITVLKNSIFIPEASSTEYDNVFEPFTITEPFRPFLKPPYTAFRIDGQISFDYFEC